MKRYIIVALLALVCSTSCLLDSGSDPDMNRSKRIIYNDRAVHPIYQAQTYAWYFVVADTFLYGSEEEQAAIKSSYDDELMVEAIEGGIRISRDDSRSYYTVTTDGKKLSEGGLWSLTSGTATKLIVTATGIEGSDKTFCLQYNANSTYDKVDMDMVVSYNYPVVSLYGSSLLQDPNGEYSIDVTIDGTTPLVYSDKIDYMGFESGVVDVVYRDLVDGTSKSFSVEYRQGKTIYK